MHTHTTSRRLFMGLATVVAGSMVSSAVHAAHFPDFLQDARLTTTIASDALPDGLLAREASSPRIYFLQGKTKRWIDSGTAFSTQGFDWADVTVVDDGALAPYAEGEAITAQTPAGLKASKERLPDLAPLAPYDLRYVTSNGRTLLKFTATFWNRGKGAFELNAEAGGRTGDGEYPASQRLFAADGTHRDRDVGVLFWHQVHVHYHYNDFGEYLLEPIAPSATAAASTMKTTFCMRDDLSIATAAEGPKQPRKYVGCSGHRQGVSVGWADVYPHTLPDQYFDVTGLKPGRYKLSFRVDDQKHFLESRRANNIATAIIDIDPAKRTLGIVGELAGFPSKNNVLRDGTLVRAEGDQRVYVMRGNKKRHLRDEGVFLSYGFSWNDVVVLPKAVVEVLPADRLIRPQGGTAIYMLNEAGYRRKILNPTVLASYGWSGGDATEVNATEFASYRDTDLVRVDGTNDVYSLNGRRRIGPLSALAALGIDPLSVHVVSAVDLDAYAVSVVAQGLDVPWDIVFLPDGDMLVTERSGALKRLGKNPVTIAVPDVLETGEGGLMGIALHPDFAKNSLVYLYFTTDKEGKHNRVERFRLDGARLVADKVIVDGIPAAIYHDGGQIAFGPDGMLYVTTGDANDPTLSQNLHSLAGKTLRYTEDGGIPSDNPFGTAVWSYGHRNSQGLAWDAKGRMWQTEHGRSGALSGMDELNLVEKGKNYGWPDSQGDSVKAGTVGPVRHSGASVTWAPSGLAAIGNDLYFAGLKGATLYHASLNDSGAIASFKERLAGMYGRLRAVVAGPDGALYVTTSNRDGRGTPRAGDDKIIRVNPQFLR